MGPAHTSYKKTSAMIFPGAIELRVLLSGKDTGGSQAVFEDLVEPGVGPSRHIHHNQDETFFFLDGMFDVEADGILYHMEPGDVAFVPRGTVHAFKNVGEVTGRIRYAFSPALSIEAMFLAFYDSMKAGTLDDSMMASIALSHGQEFVGPPL